MTYEQEEIQPIGAIDKWVSIATLVVCYIITTITTFIMLSLASDLSEGAHYSIWVWITLFSIVLYGSGGVISIHIYLINRHAKHWVTFYKVTIGLILMFFIINILRDED